MRYSDFEQRKMDAEYSERMDRVEAARFKKECKNNGFTPVDSWGGCVLCPSEQGEACRYGEPLRNSPREIRRER